MTSKRGFMEMRRCEFAGVKFSGHVKPGGQQLVTVPSPAFRKMLALLASGRVLIEWMPGGKRDAEDFLRAMDGGERRRIEFHVPSGTVHYSSFEEADPLLDFDFALLRDAALPRWEPPAYNFMDSPL